MNSGLHKAGRQTTGQIFMVPAVLAVLSGGGLVFALLEDGVWDALSWVTLAVPIAVLAACLARGFRARLPDAARPPPP